MQARFDATIEDFVDISMRSSSDSKALKAWRWEGAIISGAITGLLVYLIIPLSPVANLVLAVLAAVAGAGVSLATWENSYRKRLRRRWKEYLGSAEPVRILVELTEKGIIFDQLESRQINYWTAIERWEETNDAIYFHHRDRTVSGVRTRAFESQDSKDQFIEFATKHINDKSQNQEER